MLRLDRDQRSALYRFIANGHDPQERVDAGLEQTLAYIMVNVNVRKTEIISDQVLRKLVDATFAVIKARHLLENYLIDRAGFHTRVDAAQQQVLPGKAPPRRWSVV